MLAEVASIGGVAKLNSNQSPSFRQLLESLELGGLVLTGSTRSDQNLYLASATDNSVYIIDGRTGAMERVANVGLFPWGTHIMDSKDNYCH